MLLNHIDVYIFFLSFRTCLTVWILDHQTRTVPVTKELGIDFFFWGGGVEKRFQENIFYL